MSDHFSPDGTHAGTREGTRALVTGATGFVGSHLVEALVGRGYRLRVLVRRTSKLDWMRGLPVEIAYGDVTDKASLSGACVGVRDVFHFGALVKARTAEEFMLANAAGTRNLAESLAERGENGGVFVYCSSLAAGGPAIATQSQPMPVRSESDPDQPITPYGKSKLEGERGLREVAKASGKFRSVILRPPAVYGPRDAAILRFFKLVRAGILPLPGGEGARLSLIYVQDLVDASLETANHRNLDGVYYVSDGAVHTWTTVGEMAGDMMHARTRPFVVPPWVAGVVASVSETGAKFSGRAPLISKWKVQEMRQKHWVCTIDKARREWSFSPKFTLDLGLEKTLSWYRENRWL